MPRISGVWLGVLCLLRTCVKIIYYEMTKDVDTIHKKGWQVVWLPVLKRCISAVTGISKIFNSEQCRKFKPSFAPESIQGTLCHLAWVD